MGINNTRYKSLDLIAADPRVDEIWDEGEDGIWLALVDGYETGDGTVCHHEWTVTKLIRQFRHNTVKVS